MKKGLLTVVLMIIFWAVVGCDNGLTLSIPYSLSFYKDDNEVLKIFRSEFGEDPCLVILANKIKFNYKERIIIINGLRNIAGRFAASLSPEWVVPEIIIQDNSLIIKIPGDTAYHVYIGKKYYSFPILVEEK